MSRQAVSRLWLIVALPLAVASLVMSGYISYRHSGLTTCLAELALTDQERTAAIAAATDAERRADLALLRGAGTAEVVNLRIAAIVAREHTDRVRAEHPAPPVKPCR